MDGFFAIGVVEDGQINIVSSSEGKWIPSDAVPTFASSYQVALTCAGGLVTLRVNDQTVAEYKVVLSRSGGTYGLFVVTFEGAVGPVEFDDFQVSTQP
jgi:hypothetical protein